MNRKKNNDKNEAQSVGDAIRELLNSYKLTAKFDEANLINSWERLVGKPIAKRTKKVFIKDKILFVEFDSSSMKHDFLIHKRHVLELFTKEFGAKVIHEIIVM
jgi:predicted nucleic acid-binding Zn ribbon protein